jgi:hypothetical protein
MSRGHLYGTGDMSSHFSRVGFEGYYSSQVPSPSSSPSAEPSFATANKEQRLIETHQKVEPQESIIQTLLNKQETVETNMNKMLQWFNNMNAPQSRRPSHPDYVV